MPSRPIGVEARAAGVAGADLEARGEDQAVELVVHARRPTRRSRRCARRPCRRCRRGGTFGLVVGLQVLVVEARPLAELAVPGLQRLGRVSGRRRSRRPRARISSIFSSSLSRNASSASSGVELVAVGDLLDDPVADPLGDVGPAVLAPGPRRRSRRSGAWRSSCSHFCCQPGSSVANQSGSIGWLLRTSIDDGVRWNTYSSPRVAGERAGCTAPRSRRCR